MSSNGRSTWLSPGVQDNAPPSFASAREGWAVPKSFHTNSSGKPSPRTSSQLAWKV